MDSYYTFYYFVSAFAIGQILLMLAKILSSKFAARAEFLFCSFLFCVGIYLSQPLIVGEQLTTPYLLQLIWQHSPTAIPALFLLCSASIFQDDFQLRWSHALLLIVTVLPPLLFDVLATNSFSVSHVWLKVLLVTLPQGIEFILIIAAMWIIWKSAKHDLVETRRRFRILVMGFAGSIIFIVISAQQFSSLSEFQIDLVHYPVATLFLVALNLFLLKFDNEVLLFEHNRVNPEQIQSKAVSEDLVVLNTYMQNQQAFLDESLTITQLSWDSKIPEYRLRQAINQELGFRNFNEYLNSFRIAEACKILTASKTPITEISEQVGFNSLSAFNRAFRKIHQVTPSEYRKAQFSNN